MGNTQTRIDVMREEIERIFNALEKAISRQLLGLTKGYVNLIQYEQDDLVWQIWFTEDNGLFLAVWADEAGNWPLVSSCRDDAVHAPNNPKLLERAFKGLETLLQKLVDSFPPLDDLCSYLQGTLATA